MDYIVAHPLRIAAAFILLFIQSVFIFNDARKNGEKYYWLWGLFGMINAPGSLIVYLLVTRVFYKRKG